LFLAQCLAEVLRDHPVVAAVVLGVELGAAERLSQPGRHALGMIGQHVGEQRREQWLLGHMVLVEDVGHPPQGREPSSPLEQGRLVTERVVMELDRPVHPAAERLVLGVPTAADAVVLERRAGVVGHRVALRVQQRNPSDDPVRAVLGDLDGGCALLVDLDANLALVDCQAERPRWAIRECHDQVRSRVYWGVGGIW
jgi:hypothetical protein